MKRICVWMCFCILIGLLTGCGLHPGSGQKEVPQVTETFPESHDAGNSYVDSANLSIHLISLLENEEKSLSVRLEQDENLDPVPYPDRTSIPSSYYFGLYDLTGDGVPELLCAMEGYSGSMLNATYAVFDVMTETKLCEVDGSWFQTIEQYRDKTDGTVHTICTQYYSGGSLGGTTHVTEWTYDTGEKRIHSELLFSIEEYYRMDDDLRESPELCYSVGHEDVTKERYDAAVDLFERTYEKVPGSAIEFIANPHETDGQNDETRILRMAEQLLSTPGNRTQP